MEGSNDRSLTASDDTRGFFLDVLPRFTFPGKFPSRLVGVSVVPSRAQHSCLSVRSNVVLGPITQSDLIPSIPVPYLET